ncbi:MAG: GTPase Era [Lachnospiraceae bacterium]|nr:GTPase Era [Lachnospiraceae bacterium]
MSDNYKAGFVSIIGRPNVGKSTLMNYIIGQKIAITSNKPQTTRNRIRTVYTCDRGQIVFVDTPGIHKSKNKLGDYMVSVARKSIVDVDVVIWIVEPTTYIGAGELSIIEELKKAKDVAIFLVINKMDTIKKDEVLAVIDTYSKQMEFAEIIPVSAKTGKGVPELIDCLLDYLPEGDAFFDEDTITDQPERQIVAELIREKALWCLEDEIPHGIAVTIESMNFDKKLCSIDATIVCERESHKGIIIGKNGSMLKKIGSLARPDIEDMLEMKVFLQLWVKVRKDWRDSDLLMKNYGYNPKDLQE